MLVTVNQPTPSFLAPLSLENFFSQYWEKQPLHITREDSKVCALIDLPAIETLLSTQPVYFPGVQLTQSGKLIDVSSYADDQNVILPLRLFEQHAQGATIVLSQAQKLFTPLSDLCREATRTLKMTCQANVYISQSGNQGFNAHYDTHDVFILQVSGAKTFNFYPSSVHLPCPDEQFDAGKLKSAPIDESLKLTAGDTLYIPRGVVHDAIADDTSPSIHITLGVYPVLLRDVLLQAVHYQSSGDSRFRQSVNPFVSTDADVEEVQQTLISLLAQARSALKDSAVVLDIMKGFQDELSLGGLQDCRGLSSRLVGCVENGKPLPDFNSVELRRNLIIHHSIDEPRVTLHTFGQIVEFDAPMSGIVANLLDRGRLDRNDFGQLDTEQRDAMLRRLLQENLIELNSPG